MRKNSEKLGEQSAGARTNSLTGKPKIRALVVDDSTVTRKLIATALRQDGDIEIVAEAANATEARNAVVEHAPDVITLDIEMPGIDGLEFLRRLMSRRPTPVVMVSTLTARGSSKAIEALSLGAIDYIEKPTGRQIERAYAELRRKIRVASAVKGEALLSVNTAARTNGGVPQRQRFEPNDRIVVIGSSTGGVDAVSRILRTFPANCPPTVIVQHMPCGFTKSFADRLSRRFAPSVSEAMDGSVIENGQVLIAPGGNSHLQITGRARFICRLTEAPPVCGHRPSADVLFRSAAHLGPRAIGVILTGMGDDGATGLLEMRQRGATTIGQDAKTSVVYGMPRVASEIGATCEQLPLDCIGPRLLEHCQK